MPPEHPAADGHTVAHPPQAAGFVDVSTHPMPQSLWPAGQEQAPPTQPTPLLHALPQPPQCIGSMLRSTQEAPHWVQPPGPPSPGSSDAIQARMHSVCAGASEEPMGIGAPHGGLPAIFW